MFPIPHFRLRLVALALLASLPAQNLLFNSGFELGEAGFGFPRYLNPASNPGLKYTKVIADTSTADSGRQSLKIPNPFAEKGRLLLPECPLVPGVEYTLSFAAKTEGGPAAVYVYATSVSVAGWDVAGKEFQLAGDWKTYTFTWRTKAGWKQPFYSLRIDYGYGKEPKGGNLWFDSLRLSPSDSKGAYQPAAELEATTLFEKSVLPIPEGGTPALLTTLAINHGDARVEADAVLRLVEDHSGSQEDPIDGASIELAKLHLSLAPRERRRIETRVDLKRYGAFRLETAFVSPVKGLCSPDYAVAVWPLARKAGLPNLETTYVAGINFAGGGLRKPPSWGELDVPAYAVSMDQLDYIRMYADLGIRLFRDWDYGTPAFTWKDIEVEPGKYDFRFADKTVDDAAKFGIRVLPVLGGVEFVDWKKTGTAGWPAWIEDQCRVMKDNGAWKKDVKLPPMGPWKNFVGAVAAHFKGRISHYEIINEASGYMSSAEYMEFLRPAYEAIHAADPKAKVVGFCSTGDKGGNLVGFLGECFKQGGAAYADAVSFHPYDSPHFASLTAPDAPIEGIRGMLEKAGAGGKALWNTEVYYLKDRGPGQDKGLCLPEDAAARFLTDLGEGVKQSTPLCAQTIWKRAQAAHFQATYVFDVAHPSGVFSVYNALARFFEGAKPVGKIRWVPDSICYVFEREGKTLAAFWRYGAAEGVSIRLALDDARAELYDLYGNRLSFKSAPFPLDGRPFYVVWNGGDASEFQKILAGAELKAANAVTFGAARVLPRPGGNWAVTASVQNNLGAPLPIACGLRGESATALEIAERVLPPGAAGIVEVPLLLKPGAPAGAARFMVHGGGRIYEFPVLLATPPLCYAVGRDPGPSQALTNRARGNAPSHRASFRASHDGQKLRLVIEVADATPSGEPGARSPWEQDAIELFIDPDPDYMPMKGGGVYHDRVARMFLLPYAPKGRQAVFQSGKLSAFGAEQVRVALDPRPGGYQATVTIPFASLELGPRLPGRLIGFDLAVDDAQGPAKAEAQWMWNSTGDAYKNRLSFGLLRID
ncbi:MAG: carbohydrate binding domain-containing protein [Spirochaetes bacterium]|nr:carbohydrate binding domain-containing protein [Spirochaetota bacterium]